MSLRVERSISFKILDLKDSDLLNRTFYLNFPYISIVIFGLFSILKNLRRKRILIRLFSGEKIYLSHLILAIAITTFGLYRSFVKTFMVKKKENAIIVRDVEIRIDEVVK